ncbi:MAG: hypothetical protein IPO88_30435 [Nannocystis sp.]|uniref:hypothetical protein n=1 Tax=Nannocystis sp. TaxID=1962667 RepID=UPI002423CB7A|nr:hypothetical protein [Nannocystis sp.]MBK9757751.1 hypothetical protein [Nannocystis sp.]
MTLPRWLTTPFSTRPELRPGRALLTPTWLAALALLGVNDHLLKGSGLLPGGLTGKLSDLAGMVVAPALLAALLGLRTRRGLLFCHVAVGAVFAAIKVSPAAADAWSWLMGLVGNAWSITVDPTDLIALPVLALGWRALLPAMRRPAPRLQLTSRMAPRLAQLAAVCAGTSLSIATSSPNPPPGEEGDVGDVGDVGEWDTGVDSGIVYEDIDADAYLHNGSSADLIVRTRDLLPEVQIDCIAAEEDPGLLLSESLFGAGRTWSMPPNTNAAARDLSLASRQCYAVRVEGDSLVEPFILFWHASEIAVELIPGSIEDASQHRPGGVLLGADADGQVSVASSQREIVYEVDPFPPADAYYPGPDVERLAWSDPPLAGGAMQITNLDLGPDGCIGLEFDAGIDIPRWYLCLPADSFPFVQDQWITVESFASGDVLELTRVQGPEDVDPPPKVAMVVSRGREVPKFADTVMASKVVFDAAIAPDPDCGTVARPTEVSVRYEDGEVQVAKPGGQITLQGASTSLALWFAHAEERVILNPVCAEGPDELGLDFEVVAVRSPSQP